MPHMRKLLYSRFNLVFCAELAMRSCSAAGTVPLRTESALASAISDGVTSSGAKHASLGSSALRMASAYGANTLREAPERPAVRERRLAPGRDISTSHEGD